ncbi:MULTISPECIES: hypothetical protein [Pseudomonas]|uniref:hypothetical protein n=1 Tax=Pseudomonas TaxID=286 RepID=UPI0007617D41|nr:MULTISPECIES: hypothetical protein [Pseudomonas]MDG9809429.1 hypothetical protein [Pseudomonas juntendi]MDG9815785.1 hypothetical protein [Pseudomonas putida]
MTNANSKAPVTRNSVVALLAGIAIAIGFGTAGSSEYDQAVSDASMRTVMAEQGLWPKTVDGNMVASVENPSAR